LGGCHKFPRFERVENKIKATLPIIPLLLTYEGSYNFESSIRLDDAWKRTKQAGFQTSTAW